MTDDGRTDAAAFEAALSDRWPDLEIAPSRNETVGAGPRDRSVYTREVTPIEEFYVLNHYPTPEIDAETWTVSLTGDVEAVDLSMAGLRGEYPTTTLTHTMECAGNGRAYFASVDDEPAKYVQWEHDGASTARWTGTPLSAVLEAHDADTSEGTWVTAIGGDAPDADADVFARSLPMAKVLEDCILAYEMNGEPLPPDHGFPVRVIVPGWYGVNSVKWVEELRVMDRMIAGEEWERYTRWQQDSYRLTVDGDPVEHEDLDEFDTWEQLAAGEPESPYLYDQNVTSLVGYPDDGDVVSPGPDGTIEALGVAWAGDDRVTSVEVSVDGGETWRDAQFLAPDATENTWRRFRVELALPPGENSLVSRATDEHGRRQPAQTSPPGAGTSAIEDDAFPWNPEGYGNNAYLGYGVEFTVE